jgi:hypothetical protein
MLEEHTKFKGRVKESTMRKILMNLEKTNDIEYDGEKLRYWTGKNMFIASPVGVKYWDISIIFGKP